MQFRNIILQYTAVLLNTKRFIPVNFDGSYYASTIKYARYNSMISHGNNCILSLMPVSIFLLCLNSM